MSGTEAGYQWAKDHGLILQADVDAYTGPSTSFRNGMQRYVDEYNAAQAAKANTNQTQNGATT